jgi:hypothetical protein
MCMKTLVAMTKCRANYKAFYKKMHPVNDN